MSITRTITVHCDSCGQWADGGTHWQTVTAARKGMRGSGWHHINPSRDICPPCWKQGKR